jgi:hypothetical protein
VYDKSDESIIGFNVLGTRLRHETCDKWLQEKRNIDDVMANLHQLNFDPEFFTGHEKNILSAYNNQKGKSIKRKKKSMSLFN